MAIETTNRRFHAWVKNPPKIPMRLGDGRLRPPHGDFGLIFAAEGGRAPISAGSSWVDETVARMPGSKRIFHQDGCDNLVVQTSGLRFFILQPG